MTFEPTFYWTGDFEIDAERINRPHIDKEGEQENRINETRNLLIDLAGFDYFTLSDALNIQNELLKHNNYKGIVPGLRTHNVSLVDTPDHRLVPDMIKFWFPVMVMDKESLRLWYREVQKVHPLSDLNGRVFGIIVSVLHRTFETKLHS